MKMFTRSISIGALTICALFLLSMAFSWSARADEPLEARDVLLSKGFRPVMTGSLLRAGNMPAEHSLNWPVQFQDAQHSIGNSMTEFQPFGSPYFHGGCDLRTKAEENILAPVSGHLEAGHYSYNNRDDGSLEKFWLPWPQSGNRMYFEVAIVADDGTRYEMHHVDRDSLPQNIIDQLNKGGARVEAGTLLGHVITWPDGDYHHTHYNIILPSGIRVNPEYASTAIADHLPPQILGAYAVLANGSTIEYSGGALDKTTTEIVVDVVDKLDDNVYEHPPTLIALHFAAGADTRWDFRQTLSGADGKFPPIWDFFAASISSTSGQSSSTEGGYGTGHSLVRLKIPAGANGEFNIQIGDNAGNLTELKGSL